VLLANFSLALHHVMGTSIPVPDGDYRVINNRAEAELWVMTRTTLIALDIESDGHPSNDHPSLHSILCLGMHDGDDTVILPEHLFTTPWPELLRLLELQVTAGHNGKFDSGPLGWTCRGRNEPLRLTHDTMLLHYALWPAGGNDDEGGGTNRSYHGLKVLGPLYRGCESWALRTDEYRAMRTVPLHQLYTYNAKDVQHTWLLAMKDFLPQFAHAPRQLDAYRTVLMPASNHLSWQDGFGVPIDVPYVNNELVPEMTNRVNTLTSGLITLANEELPEHAWPPVSPAKRLPGEDTTTCRRFNPGSADQVRAILEARGVELPVDRKSKSGKGTTNEKVLTSILAKTGDQFLTDLLARRKVEKTLGTYAKPLGKAHDKHPYRGLRLFPSYGLHKTLTGRLASSGPNVQNQPKDKIIRRAHVPCGPGRVVVQSDYGQAELRVMAVLGKDKFLMEVFNDPSRDLFNELTPAMFPNVDFTGADLSDTDDPLLKPYRRPLKTCVYGLGYGRGAAAIAEETGTTEEEAKLMMTNLLSTIKGVAAWRQDTIRYIDAGLPVVSRFGRYFLHAPVSDRNREDIMRSGLSFLPQSSASDCCLLAAVDLGHYIRDNNLDWEMRALIHDAIILDVPVEDAEESAAVMAKLMQESAARWFPELPFATDAEVGTSWASLTKMKTWIEQGRPALAA
jgi:DNA polymerase I-like protein with 3'-5' exonuclease and polymerase domains